MDIDLLSKMVKELILENDRVCLPGLGCFFSQMVPSSFSDKGYTINPPYKRLSFRTSGPSDNLLASLYVTSNGVEVDVAQKIISDFVLELKEYLNANKVVIFPGLGKLRTTRENACFFVADEDLDIWPYGSVMGPVSLKTHKAVTLPDMSELIEVPSEEAKGPSDEKSGQEKSGRIEQEQNEQKQVEQEQVGLESDLREIPDFLYDGPERHVWRNFQVILLITVACALLLLCIFVVVAHFFPDFTDRLLYSPAELELLQYVR